MGKAPRLTNFSKFRRAKEREHQAAPVYDAKSVRSGVLLSAVCPRRVADREKSSIFDDDLEELTFTSITPAGDSAFGDVLHSCSTTASPGSSRPGTRQGSRPKEAIRALDIAKEEDGEEQIVDIIVREARKQDYWHDYIEQDMPKKVISEFEEWQRALHRNASPQEDGEESEVSGSFRNSAWGFTRRTPHEELVSSYARCCRETYSLPLGPRGLIGKKKLQQPAVAAQLREPGQLEYKGWSIGSEKINMFCASNGPGMGACYDCDLSGNRIGDEAMPLLCKRLLPTVEALNLSHNCLGRPGMRHLGSGFAAVGGTAPLLELNLEGNRLGVPSRSPTRGVFADADLHEQDLCDFMYALGSYCPELRSISFAQNQLGKVGSDLGHALGKLVAGLPELKVLDLHWNDFHGKGAYGLLSGMYENGHRGSRLSRVDLSWNRLGTADHTHKRAVPAKVLCDVLEDHRGLFHLDISYNSISAEDCEYIAKGLRANQTLYGLHVAGNEAAVDAFGYLIPRRHAMFPAAAERKRRPKSGSRSGAATPGQAQWNAPPPPWEEPPKVNDTVISFPERSDESGRFAAPRSRRPENTPRPSIPRRMQSKEVVRKRPHAVALAASFDEHPLSDAFSLRAEHCWICDRWQTVKLKWTPGVSGDLGPREVKSVHAFVSADDYSRPTQLERKELDSEEHGTTVWWEGYRIVPPTYAAYPTLVVFRVNGALELAHDMRRRRLPMPVAISRVGPGEPAESDGDPGAPRDQSGAAHPDAPDPNKTQYANLLSTEPRREGRPFLITEDLAENGRLDVRPRTITQLNACPKTKQLEKWNRAASMLSPWRVYDERLLEKMLIYDLKFIKFSKFLNGNVTAADLKKAIMPFYAKIVATYRQFSVYGDTSHIFGVNPHSIEVLLQKHDFFDLKFPNEHLAVLVGSAMSTDTKLHGEIRFYSGNSLIRYQFVELLIRILEAKYVRAGRAKGILEAIPVYLSALPINNELKEEAYFRSCIHIEEVDLVFRVHAILLHSTYDMYIASGTKSLASSGGQRDHKLMSLPDWYRLLNDCDAYDDSFVRRKGALAFSMGTMWHVDEVSTDRHMHMNFVEFLMALGAVVYMRDYFYPEEFADLLEEFILDNIQPIMDDQRDWSRTASLGQQTPKGLGSISGPSIRRTIYDIFQEADEDGNGLVSLREFRKVVRDPRTVQMLKGHTVGVDDFLRLFGELDADESGNLSYKEMEVGLLEYRKRHLAESRAKVFLRQVLSDFPENPEGMIADRQVVQVLLRPGTQRKLVRFGIHGSAVRDFLRRLHQTGSPLMSEQQRATICQVPDPPPDKAADKVEHAQEDVEALFKRGQPKLLKVSDVIQGILQLRRLKSVPKWKIIVQHIFTEADRELTGTVSAADLRHVLQSSANQARLVRCGITLDLLEGLLSKCADFTETEFLYGVQDLLQNIHRSLRKATSKPL